MEVTVNCDSSASLQFAPCPVEEPVGTRPNKKSPRNRSQRALEEKELAKRGCTVSETGV